MLDASVVVAWLLVEHEAAPAKAVADLLLRQEGLVPACWSLEVCNAVRKAVRTGRITADTQVRLQQALAALPIHVDPPSVQRDWTAVLPLALQEELSTYDAAYLELALREGVPLATCDDALRATAARLGITCLPAP